jgi:hypothetical protein
MQEKFYDIVRNIRNTYPAVIYSREYKICKILPPDVSKNVLDISVMCRSRSHSSRITFSGVKPQIGNKCSVCNELSDIRALKSDTLSRHIEITTRRMRSARLR